MQCMKKREGRPWVKRKKMMIVIMIIYRKRTTYVWNDVLKEEQETNEFQLDFPCKFNKGINTRVVSLKRHYGKKFRFRALSWRRRFYAYASVKIPSWNVCICKKDREKGSFFLFLGDWNERMRMRMRERNICGKLITDMYHVPVGPDKKMVKGRQRVSEEEEKDSWEPFSMFVCVRERWAWLKWIYLSPWICVCHNGNEWKRWQTQLALLSRATQ